jgi:hypothetical protein
VGDTAAHTDALSIGPYFWVVPAEEASVRRMSVDGLMGDLETTILPRTKAAVGLQAAVAARYGVPLIAYEGGQHLLGSEALRTDPTLNALYDAANRDARMGTLYSRYLQDWADAGGQLFVHFANTYAYGQGGRFGSLEYLSQPRADAPKYDALMRWIEGR